jgi:hypothetical protein
MPQKEAVQSPQQLGEQYLRELRELLDEGEISAAFAQRVRDDLFETGGPDQLPALKWSVWCSYVEDQQQLSFISELRKSS